MFKIQVNHILTPLSLHQVFINIYQILDKSSSEAIHSVIPLLGFDSWSTITQVNKPTTANSSRSTNSNPTTSAATSNPKNTQVEVFLRTILFKEYLIRLRKSIEAKDIPESSISSDTLLRLNSAFLLGSSSERIAGAKEQCYEYLVIK